MEVTRAALPVLEALEVPVQVRLGELGWSCWQRSGSPIPPETWELIRSCDATLLGAITSKPPREAEQELPETLRGRGHQYLSPLISLRQDLQLYANLRPCFSLTGRPFRFCVLRENTEGLYAGFDFHPLPPALRETIDAVSPWKEVADQDLACSLRLQSRAGLLRLFEMGFRLAQEQGYERVTLADKPNVLRQSGAFARAIFEQVAAGYPGITCDIQNVDAVAHTMVRKPQSLGVVVAENMFGDILSDVGAGVMGGLGLAPSANIGATTALFEPVHGSGPRIAPGRANPGAMFLTISLLLRYLGLVEAGERIVSALRSVIEEGRFLTYDLGGSAGTDQMASAIIDRVACTSASRDPLDILSGLGTSEVSDALDACGVEGALLGIRPLQPGRRLLGPAHTITFGPAPSEPGEFRPAANYIDEIPPHSVLLIDNQGRDDCTVWGSLLTEAALQRKLAGTIVYGAVRDVADLRRSSYAVFSSSSFMRSGKNRVRMRAQNRAVELNGVTIQAGDILMADDNGALAIPAHLLDEVARKALVIAETERRIRADLRAGTALEQARARHGYTRPWEK